MTPSEVAELLRYQPAQVIVLIETGYRLPISKKRLKLGATKKSRSYDISEQQFDAFAKKCEAEEPSRWPPVAVRRALLLESQYRCAVCSQPLPLEYHHMIDWHKLKHHDPEHMLAVCEIDHGKCTRGQIDYKAQVEIKARLRKNLAERNRYDARKSSDHKSDLKVLRELFELIPRKHVCYYLDEAINDAVYYDVTNDMSYSARVVAQPIFHLFDKECLQLLKAFYEHWNRASSIAVSIVHDNRGSGVAYARWTIEEERIVYERWREQLRAAHHALQVLNSYIREEFPELDLEETDRIASEGFRKAKMESDKRVKKMWADAKKPATRRLTKKRR